MVWVDGGTGVWKLTNYPRDDLHLKNVMMSTSISSTDLSFYLGFDKLVLLSQLSLAHNLVVVLVNTEEVVHICIFSWSVVGFDKICLDVSPVFAWPPPTP